MTDREYAAVKAFWYGVVQGHIPSGPEAKHHPEAAGIGKLIRDERAARKAVPKSRPARVSAGPIVEVRRAMSITDAGIPEKHAPDGPDDQRPARPR